MFEPLEKLHLARWRLHLRVAIFFSATPHLIYRIPHWYCSLYTNSKGCHWYISCITHPSVELPILYHFNYRFSRMSHMTVNWASEGFHQTSLQAVNFKSQNNQFLPTFPYNSWCMTKEWIWAPATTLHQQYLSVLPALLHTSSSQLFPCALSQAQPG